MKNRYIATAFSGDGAKSSGARWNSPGTAIVYTADTPATAALEILAQDYPARSLAQHWSLLTATFPDDLVEILDVAALPDDWSVTPWPAPLPAIGDRWIAEQRSLVLAVPSAVLPFQRNLLINPTHPKRRALKISGPQPFTFDARILQKMVAGAPE